MIACPAASPSSKSWGAAWLGAGLPGAGIAPTVEIWISGVLDRQRIALAVRFTEPAIFVLEFENRAAGSIPEFDGLTSVVETARVDAGRQADAGAAVTGRECGSVLGDDHTGAGG